MLGHSEPPRWQPGPRVARRGGAVVLALGLLLFSCVEVDSRDSGDAQPLNQPPADPPSIPAETVPPPLDSDPLWAAPFSTDPKPVGDGFVGLDMPDDEHSDLRFLGVAANGATRWSASRNPSCTAFAVTRADGRHLVVLLDSDADPEQGFAATRVTAGAYDPTDGTQVWGPVEVPGTLIGPGLVFAESVGSVMSDESGRRVALAPDDGSVVADERDSDTTILHEHEGALLTRDDDIYRVVDTTTGDELWSSDDLTPPDSLPPDVDTARVVYGPRPVSDSSSVVALGWRASTDTAEEDEDAYTIHDLRTGELLAQLDGAREPEVYEAADGVSSVVNGLNESAETVLAFSGTELLWRTPDIGDMRLERVTGGAIYLSDGETTHAFALDTGDFLGAGAWEMPMASSTDGTTLVQVDSSGDGDLFVALVPETEATEGDV